MSNSKPAVTTLYVVPDCPLCAHARECLKEMKMEFVERDVANDFGALRAMYKLTKQDLVPVLEVRGHTLVRPTDEELANVLL